VSTNLFWKQVYEEKPPRSLWQNLRHLLSLLAQLLLLLLLVLAIADPYFSWQALQARRLVVVIDTSASMKATDISPSRFEAARSAVHRAIDGLRFRDEMAIVTAGSQPEVVLGMANHVPTLRRAVDSVEPVDASAAMEAAVELAKQLIGDHPHGQVLVYSDGCAQRPSEIVTTSVAQPGKGDQKKEEPTEKPDVKQPEVVNNTFASSASNVGITQFQARRSLIDPIGYEVLVSVKNASAAPVKGRLELELEGIPVDVIPLNLKPDEVWTRSLEKTSLEGGVLKASLTQLSVPDSATESSESSPAANSDKPAKDAAESSPDSPVNMLPTDDIAWGIVPPRKVQNVLIVTPGNLFLRKVFEANPLVNISIANELPSQWPTDTIVVLHRLIPSTLPSTPVLVVDPESDSDAWKLGATIENPIVTEQDEDSPLMTHIRMDNVLMPEAKRMEFNLPFKQLAATVTGEAVYAELQRPSGRCLVLSVNLEKSDLAFRTAFPILITNALGWFAGQPGDLQPALSGGQLASFDRSKHVEAAATETASMSASNLSRATEKVQEKATATTPASTIDSFVLVSPSGSHTPLVSQQVGPMNEVGIWNVHRSTSNDDSKINAKPNIGPILENYAVNLANVGETDLRPVEETAETSNASKVASGWFSRPLWYYLTFVACLFCTIEWYLYQRRFIS
jgi:hypothetical protein